MDLHIKSNSSGVALAGKFYRPELDVLRFVAFLMIYLSHSIPVETESPHWLKALWNVLSFGVPLFFTLSAYLITELLFVEKRRTGTVNTKAFYARRILRIWPLYYFVLSIGFSVSRLHPGWEIPVHGFVAYLLLVGNWYTAHHGFLSSGIGPLWTVEIEEQFYFFSPLLVFFLTRRRLGITCALAWVISQCVLINLCHGHADIRLDIFTNTLVNLQYFALGAGLSLFLNGSAPKISPRWRLVLIPSVLLALFVADFVLNPDQPDDLSSIAHTYPEFLLVGLATTLMLAGFLGYSALEKQRTLRYLGKISYGLYVFHVPCLMVVAGIVSRVFKIDSAVVIGLIGFPLAVAVASISYRYLETPFLHMKERFEIVKSRAV